MTAADHSAPTQLSLDSATPRILVADAIAEDGVERLRTAGQVDVLTTLSPQELLSRIPSYDALVVRSETQVTAALLAAAARLRVVGRAGVGVDNIDLDAATRQGVLVLNAPTGNTIAAAEHAVAMMCALVRNLAAADASMRAGRWERARFMGTELREKTLGILGLGKIGLEVSRIAAQGLLMRVIAHDPLVAPERAEQAGVEIVELEALLAHSDVLSVHVPLTENTRGCIGAAQLRAMRRGSFVVNVARGGIVDEQALADAVDDGHLAGAAIDVFTIEPPPADHPLLRHPKVLTTPHLGASTREAQVNVAYEVADQIAQVLGGGTARYAVNAPVILPEEMAALRPYLDLAYRMGSLAHQMSDGGLRQVHCSYSGELAEHDTVVLTSEALRGLLSPFTDMRINPINAKAVARSHGVEVVERSGVRSVDWENTMVLEVTGRQHVTLAGTHFEGQPQITRINEHRVTMPPRGHYLIGTNEDRPGVIAAVSTLLADNGINIARIEVGRDQPYGYALMLVQTDEPVPETLLDELRRRRVLESLRAVSL